MDASNTALQLSGILKSAAQKLGLQNYSVDANLGPQGDGFLGDLYKVSITDDETNTTIHLVIKKAPVEEARRRETCITSAYYNEIYFYTTVIPSFIKLQEQNQIKKIFDLTPNYITSVGKIGEEIIVLNDISKLGFEMMERNLEFDEEYCRFVFGTYGRFHAISFCLKDQKPNEYADLIKPIREVLVELGDKESFSGSLNMLAQMACAALDPIQDIDVREKFEKYADNATDMYKKSLEYTGNYSAILHGDCWSNNMMFKHKGSKVENIKLVDFQLIQVGTPVYDLSYFFYSGATKESFNKLEEFLDVYYENFSEVVEEMGSDPIKLLPRQILSEDWKKYSKFGMLMSLIITQVKLMSRENTVEITKSLEQGETHYIFEDIAETPFNTKIRGILTHMFEIGAL